jgi:hypothetical protein
VADGVKVISVGVGYGRRELRYARRLLVGRRELRYARRLLIWSTGVSLADGNL